MDELVLCHGVVACFESFLLPTVIVGTAIVAWRVQLNVLARRAAWDFIAQYEQSGEWQKIADEAKLLLADKPLAADWADFAGRWDQRKPTDADKETAARILNWANRKEFVGIALLNGTMHKKTYAQWWGWEYVEEWKQAAGFVEALMKTSRGDGELFENFEKVATNRAFRRLAKRPRGESLPPLGDLRNYKRKEMKRSRRTTSKGIRRSLIMIAAFANSMRPPRSAAENRPEKP